MPKLYDFSITAGPFNDTMVLHRPDCPKVDEWRVLGLQICTMYGCETIPEIERCECLENVELARSAVG